MEFEKIKAFNRNASIGDLYDSRTMEIINVIDLFKSTDFKNYIESTPTPTPSSSQLHFINLENPKEKYSKLEINPIIKLDLQTLTGPSKLIFEEKKSKRSIMKLLFHSLNTNYEKIDLTDQNVIDLLNHNILEEHENTATHIICGIQYGLNTIATFEYENSENSNNKQQLHEALNSYLEENNSNNSIKNLKINFESDLILDKTPQNYKDIKDFLANIPTHLNDNNNKGIPLEFTLFQIDKLTNKQAKELKEIKLDQIENELFNLIEVKQELNDYIKDLNDNKKLFHSEFIQLINQKHEDIESNENYLKIKFKPILDSIRRNEESFKLDELFLNDYNKCDYSSASIKLFIKEILSKKHEKIKKIKDLKLSYKIDYLIEDQKSLNQRKELINKNIYILFTSEELQNETTINNTNWIEIYDFYLRFVQSIDNKDNNSKFFISDNIDLNASWDVLDNEMICVIHQYRNGKCLNNNVFDSNKQMFTINRAKCSNLIKTLKPAPKPSTILEINCPNNLKRLKCTENRIKWTCEQCKSVFIYGFDFKFYCKCGGGECSNFRFKCADINHQNEFVRFSDNQLKSLLNKFYHSKY
jgi:hypothetical protein